MTLLSFQIFRGLHKAARNLMPFSGKVSQMPLPGLVSTTPEGLFTVKVAA